MNIKMKYKKRAGLKQLGFIAQQVKEVIYLHIPEAVGRTK